MNSGAALAGVEAEAGCGIGVVGKFSAPIQVDGNIGFARGDDLDSASGEKGAQADIQREVGGFFELSAVEMSTGIVAAVGCIEDYDETGCRSRGRRLGCWQRRNGLLRRAG